MTVADLERALGETERALLDSTAIIAFHTSSEAVHSLADHLFRRIASASDPLHGYYSHLSATEVLIRPLRTSQERFTYMHTFLTEFPNLAGLPFDFIVSVQAATLTASMRLPPFDAAIIATGMLAGCEAIVTNDERWKKRGEPLFPRFRWIYLDDYR
jgi:predicted nucleic acid-binding protein